MTGLDWAPAASIGFKPPRRVPFSCAFQRVPFSCAPALAWRAAEPARVVRRGEPASISMAS